MYPTWSWENAEEKSGCLLEKLIHKITHSDYLSTHQKSLSKKSPGNTIVRFLQGIRFHTEREDEANEAYGFSKETTTFTDALPKHKSSDLLTQ